MNQRDDNIDILRGIAIALVYLGHSIILTPLDMHQVPWCAELFRIVSALHMPLFFVISGWCYAQPGSYRAYIEKKILRLMVPYLVFGVADLLPRVFVVGLLNRPISLEDGFLKLALYGGEYWFLYTLFVLMVVFPLITRAVGEWKGAWAVVLIVVCLVLHFVPVTELLTARYLAYYSIFFALGHCVRMAKFSGQFTNLFLRGWAFGAFAGLSLLFYILGKRWDFWGATFAFTTSGILLLNALAARISGVVKEILVILGRNSLSLYLLNGFLVVFGRLFVVKILHVEIPFAVVASIFILNVVGALSISHYFLNRYSWLRIIAGIPQSKKR